MKSIRSFPLARPYGNQTANLDKDIVAVRYNDLNLPDTVQFGNGNRIIHYYLSGGERVCTVSRTYTTALSVPLDRVSNSNDPYTETTDTHVGNLVYRNESPDRLQREGGYWEIRKKTGTVGLEFHPFVYICDHLGSIRLVYDGVTGEIAQSLEYLPSGMIYRCTDYDRQPNRFTGKELLSMHGLNQYDSKARMQEFQLPGFTTPDPLCEKYYSISPYVYCGNNPVNRIDPTGMIWDDVKEAERLKGQIDDRIASLNKNITNQQAKLDKGGLSDKQVAKIEGKISESQSRISNLNISKSDIDKLGADENNVYALSPISGGEHKVRQGNDGKIHIETSSAALSIHEITHVRQSLDAGGLQFSQNGELLNVGKGQVGVSRMEIEAYKMQYSYDRSFPGSLGGKGLQGIDVHSVGGIMNNGLPAYPVIYQYSIAIMNDIKEKTIWNTIIYFL